MLFVQTLKAKVRVNMKLLTVKAKETVAAVIVDQVRAVPMLHTGKK